ncbi:hypothetical protein [Peptostreptococcus sp. D1]|uniref:hypothetical protein n=1 Tax=Peptostreptococcus sp. D1 TaxID=72304 RepID=UPI0008E3BDE5|nr:hypothetical protein [Peptostreptococcus sp. D1]SFE19822.1 hypothetical protein SAMN02910278_00216 [Peptostreptococcus sp. D1]
MELRKTSISLLLDVINCFKMKVIDIIDGYRTIKETAWYWNITERQVQYLCANGQVEGVVKFGRV